MNAYAKTAGLIIETLTGINPPGSIFPHINSDMRVITSRYRPGKATLHIVSVGSNADTYFLADNDDVRWLREGCTPDELQLTRCGDSFPDED